MHRSPPPSPRGSRGASSRRAAPSAALAGETGRAGGDRIQVSPQRVARELQAAVQPGRPLATATPAATLTTNAAHVTCAGDNPSVTWQSRSSGRVARSSERPTAGAKSNTMLEPVDADVGRE